MSWSTITRLPISSITCSCFPITTMLLLSERGGGSSESRDSLRNVRSSFSRLSSSARCCVVRDRSSRCCSFVGSRAVVGRDSSRALVIEDVYRSFWRFFMLSLRFLICSALAQASCMMRFTASCSFLSCALSSWEDGLRLPWFV